MNGGMLKQRNHNRPTCLVCGSKSKKSRRWGRREIVRAYSALSNIPLPLTASLIDYTIWRCASCRLIFADPPVPGNEPFYSWVAAISWYYPKDRWEWHRVAQRFAGRPSVDLLEIGCGTGNFLRFIARENSAHAVGLDTHGPSVDECRRNGLEAYCLSIDEFAAANPGRRFDCICAFHCVEHVADPVALIISMTKMLAPSGVLVVSMPYSPMPDELITFDCLSFPPHHLTQWSQRSLSALAARCELNMSFESNTAADFESLRSIFWYFLDRTGGKTNALIDYARPLLQPLKFSRLLWGIYTRDKVHGTPAGNVALAFLSAVQESP